MQKKQLDLNFQFKFSQIFGSNEQFNNISQQNKITVLKFDQTGNYLAVGDNLGRIIIFKQNDDIESQSLFRYYTEFEGHSKQFDLLNSVQIQSRVINISWLRNQGKYLKMLTSNQKKIKLWKIYEKEDRKVTKSSGQQLSMPRIHQIGSQIKAIQQFTFPLIHSSVINSVCQSNNEQYLLSSDDVHIYLWSLNKTEKKPLILQDLLGTTPLQQIKQTITCSKFHPISDSIYLYGTNTGKLRMGDLRCQVISNNITEYSYKSSAKKNFFSDMLASYSSIQFLSETKIIARDYLSVKIWDIANPTTPLKEINIQDGIKGKLCQIFENDAIFDKFKLCASHSKKLIATGSYNNNFHLIDIESETNAQYQLSYQRNTIVKQVISKKPILIKNIDYQAKTIVCDFHPKSNTVAIASKNSLFLYSN